MAKMLITRLIDLSYGKLEVSHLEVSRKVIRRHPGGVADYASDLPDLSVNF